MRSKPTGFFSTLSRRSAMMVAGAALLSLTATLAFAKGKPGGGGEDPPPPPPPPVNLAPIYYQLTWLPGFGGDTTHVWGVNAAGWAVGNSMDVDSIWHGFVADSNGVMTAADTLWQMPPGYEQWRVHRIYGINEANQVCGVIADDQSGEREIFLADRTDPASLEPLGLLPENYSSYGWHLSENGDIAFRAMGAVPYLYVRSLHQTFSFPNLVGYLVTGLNDNLQMSLLAYNRVQERRVSYDYYYNSARLTVAPAGNSYDLEILGTATDLSKPVTWAFDIDNSGTVFGGFEDQAPTIKRTTRRGNARAGSIAFSPDPLQPPLPWVELNPLLPSGSQELASGYQGVVMAACAINVNEFGQVLGGYNREGDISGKKLWLDDPEDGLFNLDDLVVGSSQADGDAFRNARSFWEVEISEIEPTTGYGIITGWVSNTGLPDRSFILTPRLVQQP